MKNFLIIIFTLFLTFSLFGSSLSFEDKINYLSETELYSIEKELAPKLLEEDNPNIYYLLALVRYQRVKLSSSQSSSEKVLNDYQKFFEFYHEFKDQHEKYTLIEKNSPRLSYLETLFRVMSSNFNSSDLLTLKMDSSDDVKYWRNFLFLESFNQNDEAKAKNILSLVKLSKNRLDHDLSMGRIYVELSYLQLANQLSFSTLKNICSLRTDKKNHIELIFEASCALKYKKDNALALSYYKKALLLDQSINTLSIHNIFYNYSSEKNLASEIIYKKIKNQDDDFLAAEIPLMLSLSDYSLNTPEKNQLKKFNKLIKDKYLYNSDVILLVLALSSHYKKHGEVIALTSLIIPFNGHEQIRAARVKSLLAVKRKKEAIEEMKNLYQMDNDNIENLTELASVLNSDPKSSIEDKFYYNQKVLEFDEKLKKPEYLNGSQIK